MRAIETGFHAQIGGSKKRGQYFTKVLSIAICFFRSPGGAAYYHKWYCSDYTNAKILSWSSQESPVQTSGF